MKIVHVFKDFYPPLAAGITCYIHDVAEETARRGHEVEVHVAGVRTACREELPGGVVVNRHREWGRLLSSPISPGLTISARRATADVLHVHMPNPAGELGVAFSPSSVPVVATFHARLGRQQFLEPLYGPLRCRVLDRCAAILVSNATLAQVPELEPVGSKVTVLPFGVSPRRVATPTEPAAEGTTLRVLVVGRLVYYKGVDVLVRALAELGGCTLTVIGEGPLRPDLEELVATLALQDRVRFRGSVSDDELREAYGSHDVFVLPSISRAEAFGIAMAEAMASGLPVVSTELGTGTSWVNLDGVSGLVVPPGDSSALRQALARLRQPELRATLATGALRRAEELFRFDRHCDRLLDVYSSVRRNG